MEVYGGTKVYGNNNFSVFTSGAPNVVVFNVSVGNTFTMQCENAQYNLAKQSEFCHCVVLVLPQEILCNVAIQPFDYTVSAYDIG